MELDRCIASGVLKDPQKSKIMDDLFTQEILLFVLPPGYKGAKARSNQPVVRHLVVGVVVQ